MRNRARPEPGARPRPENARGRTGAHAAKARELPPWGNRLIAVIVVAFALLVPVFYSFAGKDVFGLPKEILFRAEGLLILCVAAVAWLTGGLRVPSIHLRDPLFALPSSILVWTAVSAAASTRPMASLVSFCTVLFSVVIFWATLDTARGSRALLRAVLMGALANAVLVLLEAWHLWKGFNLDPPLPAPPGLLGNPNVAGTYLVVPALAAVAFALSVRGWKRLAAAVLAALLLGAIVETLALTALIAFFGGALMLAFLRSWRQAVVLALLLMVGASVAAYTTPLGDRLVRLTALASQGEWNRFLTFRLAAYTAALEMAHDHPLVGVGPGQFSWNYFDYKIEAERRHPQLFPPGARGWRNSAQAHNDHLQAMAETGLPGFALFVAAIVIVGRRSFVKTHPPPERSGSRSGRRGANRFEIARLLALPLAVSFAIVSLAQFPLQLAAPRLTYLTFAAMCLAWVPPREDA